MEVRELWKCFVGLAKAQSKRFDWTYAESVLMTPSFNIQFHIDTDLFISHKDTNSKINFAHPK